MRKLSFTLLYTLLCTLASFAQQDNYSFIKLIILNTQDEVLLVKWNDAWEIPGARYDQPVPLAAFVDTLAAEHGIAVDRQALNGLFTFAYMDRPTVTLMHYYTAKHTKGVAVVPANCDDISWFSLDAALDAIPYPEMKLMLGRILSAPERTWGAAIQKRNDGSFSFIDPFYVLH